MTICEHNQLRALCKECDESAILERDREIARLREVLADAADVVFSPESYHAVMAELQGLLAPYRRGGEK